MAEREETVKSGETGWTPAADEVYRRHFDRIFAFVYGRLEDRDQGLEITQEVFYRFLKGGRGPSLPEDEVVRYLYGIARNVVADFFADRKSWRSLDVDAGSLVPPARWDTGIDTVLARQCLDRLNETDRTILARYFYRGDTHREIASSLGMSPGNVRQRFHRALLRLRTWFRNTDV